MASKPSASKIKQIKVITEVAHQTSECDVVQTTNDLRYANMTRESNEEDFNVMITEESLKPEPCRIMPPTLQLSKS